LQLLQIVLVIIQSQSTYQFQFIKTRNFALAEEVSSVSLEVLNFGQNLKNNES